MTDDAADRWAKSEQVSIPVVLVAPGQDKVQALLKAGILDPVEIPFIMQKGDQNQTLGLGDGITPNLQATLELTDGTSNEADKAASRQPVERDVTAPANQSPANTAPTGPDA